MIMILALKTNAMIMVIVNTRKKIVMIMMIALMTDAIMVNVFMIKKIVMIMILALMTVANTVYA
jgi:hypothetical protein